MVESGQCLTPSEDRGTCDSPPKDGDLGWRAEAIANAIWVVSNAQYPWSERHLRIWFIGNLCKVFTKEALENATLDQLREWHRETSK